MDTTRNVDRPPRILGQVMGATLVLLLATIVFTMTISGSFRNYLQEWLGPWLLASAVAMGALSLWTLLDVTDTIAGLKGNTHEHGFPKSVVFLLLPALLFALSAPASLGANAASSTATKSRSSSSDLIEFPPLSADSVTEMSVQDFEDRYTFGDPKLLVERPVRLLGFVAKQSTLPEGQWSVNRFRIYCCVADASLFTVSVEGVARPEGDNVWVEVEGVINLDASEEHPVLTASRVKVIQQPEDPYL